MQGTIYKNMECLQRISNMNKGRDLININTNAKSLFRIREKRGFLDQLREFWRLQRLDQAKIKALPTES